MPNGASIGTKKKKKEKKKERKKEKKRKEKTFTKLKQQLTDSSKGFNDGPKGFAFINCHNVPDSNRIWGR
jgi:hypothetical protein